jgi:sugar phosphate permease
LTESEESRPGVEGWRVVAAAAVGVCFAALVVVTFPVFLKPWAEAFGWSRRDVSVAFALAALCAGLAAAPLGHLLDRLGARRVAVPSLLLLGALFASLGLLGPGLAQLYLTFAALGVAAIGTSPVAYGRAVATWFVARRGLALALVITGGAVGGIVHPLVTESLIRRIGWRGACVVLGVAVVAIGVPLVLRFVRERPAAQAGAPALEGATRRAARARGGRALGDGALGRRGPAPHGLRPRP